MTLAAFAMWAATTFTGPSLCQDDDACAWADAAEHDDPKSSAPMSVPTLAAERVEDCRGW